VAFLLGQWGDFRVTASTKQELFENVCNAINARMTAGAVPSLSIGGLNLQYISLSELMKLRDKFRNNHRQENEFELRMADIKQIHTLFDAVALAAAAHGWFETIHFFSFWKTAMHSMFRM
jgi:hypothetical protein